MPSNLGLFLRHMPPAEQLVFLIVIVAVLAVRFVRPRGMRDILLLPGFLCGLAVAAIYAAQTINPVPPMEIVPGLIVGGAAGILIGILRGIHTEVRSGVTYIGRDWAPIGVFVAAFALYYAANSLMPQRSGLASIVSDAALAFATTFTATNYLSFYRRAASIIDSTRS
jgi:hypothetical protein